MKSLAEIAKEMGISRSTVSYVYSDKWREKRISAELANRILAKLRQENAMPNMISQQLRSGSTHTTGLLLPNLAQLHFLDLLSGVSKQLSQEGYMLFLGNPVQGHTSRQTDFLKAMVARSVDHVILSPLPDDGLTDMLDSIRAKGVPVVFVNNYLKDYDVPFVVSDNRWGAKELVSHLLEEGRRRIMYVGMTPAPVVSAFEDRLAGYLDAHAEAGLKPPKDGIIWRGDIGQGDEKRVQSMRDILSGRDRPDAIFFDSLFGCDFAILAMHELGIKHPDDVLISGFDYPAGIVDRSEFYEIALSPLMSIQQDARRMGLMAAELALQGTVAGSNSDSIFLRPFLPWEQSGNKLQGAGSIHLLGH